MTLTAAPHRPRRPARAQGEGRLRPCRRPRRDRPCLCRPHRQRRRRRVRSGEPKSSLLDPRPRRRRRRAGERRGQLVFSSNRGENTIGVFAPGPNPGSDQDRRRRAAQWARLRPTAAWCSPPMSAIRRCRIPTRSPWSISTRAPCGRRSRCRAARAGRCSIPTPRLFYVNIMRPSQIVVVDARQPDRIARTIADPGCRRRTASISIPPRAGCSAPAMRACWSPSMPGSGKVLDEEALERRARRRLVQPPAPAALCRGRRSRRGRRVRYDLDEELARVATEKGAHTTAFPPAGDRLFAFLPASHRAALFET